VPGPGLIGDYLRALSAQLPGPVVAELADGLDLTWRRYRGQGLGEGAAARAALAEFGDPGVIVAAFTRLSPARRAARRLLAIGPGVGVCWGAALVTSRAWAWPIPIVARVAFGLVLVIVIGLLAAAAFGRTYRSVGRAAAAGCVGTAVLDTAMLVTVTLTGPALTWLVIVAMAASGARLTVTARALRPVLVI
jgi:hypothetical protein